MSLRTAAVCPAFVLVPFVALLGCTSADAPSLGEQTEQTGQALISDQFHSTGTEGFVWLPPMVPNPPRLGELVPDVPASVRIDELNPDGSILRTLATFAGSKGPSRVRVHHYPPKTVDRDDDDGDRDDRGYYLARWITDDAHLSENGRYRVRVLVPARGGGTRELGFADVAVVRNQGQYKTVDTENFTPLVNGKVLRIKFRIEPRAVDADADGVVDWLDNCAAQANPTQLDSVGNGVGDACRCVGVTCAASDACHLAGTCRPETGACTNPVAADGTACPSANGRASCRAGTCMRESCDAGWGDCDGVAANGCELGLDTTSNCGACGLACPGGENASAICAAGSCGLACAGGWADCDGNASNGCERPVSDDPSNCGGCNLACSNAQGCLAGACTTAVCQTGFADCNGSSEDGCEDPVASDPRNCGTCGHLCSFAHASSATCSAGACRMGSCDAGWADCNQDPSDGCEVNLQDDIAHCGACGGACSVSHAAPLCAAGTCAVAACDAGFADCNQLASDGCEVDLRADGANCGACGAACGFAHGSAACSAGSCALTGCDEGAGDCDGIAANGCETETALDPRHCGACGAVCVAGPNATPHCAAGGCGATCDAGFVDCNGDPTDGCEAHVDADAANCGACGNACGAGESCQSGACAPVPCSPGTATCGGAVCDVSTATDPSNCGACGRVCTAPNAYPTCDEGSCGFGVCQPWFGDCNGVTADGCEAALKTDLRNCGGCGRVCPAGTARCEDGVCLPASVCQWPASCPEGASCAFPSRPDGTPCGDDGNACTTEQCAAGRCVSVQVQCTEAPVCNAPTCDPSAGCSFVPTPTDIYVQNAHSYCESGVAGLCAIRVDETTRCRCAALVDPRNGRLTGVHLCATDVCRTYLGFIPSCIAGDWVQQ